MTTTNVVLDWFVSTESLVERPFASPSVPRVHNGAERTFLAAIPNKSADAIPSRVTEHVSMNHHLPSVSNEINPVTPSTKIAART